MSIKRMNEKEIRDNLIVFLKNKYSCNKDVSFIKELFIAQFKQRADLVVANGKLISFEIKSELDSLSRLPKQLESYTKHFEETIVVCAEKHFEKVKNISNLNVGIWIVSQNGKFKIVKNPKTISISKEYWLSHLPVKELQSLLKIEKQSYIGKREVVVERAIKNIEINKIREFVIHYFKSRELKLQLLKSKQITKNEKDNQNVIGINSLDCLKFCNETNFSQSYKIIPRQTLKNLNPQPIDLHLNFDLN